MSFLERIGLSDMKSIFWVKLVGVIFGVFVQKATYAWNWPNTEPVDQTRVVHITADRAVLPSARYSIFSREIVAYKQNDNEYGLGNFVCLSSSDPATGACYDTWINKWRPSDTAIRLRLTERRTRVSRILTLIGNQYPLWNNNGYCSDIGKRGLGGAQGGNCEGKGINGNQLDLWFDQGSLEDLPFGGIWEGDLILDYVRWTTKLARYTVHFRIDLTDRQNIQVWLPQFAQTHPQVDLNITPFHGGGLKGKNVVDMCFYDGYSTNSSSVQLQFYDNDGSGAGTDTFNITNSNGVKLPYKISMAFQGGRSESIINNQRRTLSGNLLPVNWVHILPVKLPGISVPVLCWPATLTLNANLPVSQPAGNYRGQLTVVFTPST
ncbi:TPA: hypothetical protein JLP67_004628 [Escherichia coli]|nr:hypothetical protein [Escherichia coli]